MEYSEFELDELSLSDEYAGYIVDNCGGDRVICNGNTLLLAMEEHYLFDDFIASRKKN